jgi:hypothetical protein
VFKDRIKSGKKHNFKVPKNQKRIYDFDFDSVMLYGWKAFAKEAGDFTMLKWDGTGFESQRNHLSELDQKVLRAMYPDLRVPSSRIYSAGVPVNICDFEGRPNDPDVKWVLSVDDANQTSNVVSFASEEGIKELDIICLAQSWFWESTKPYPDGSALTKRSNDPNWHTAMSQVTLIPVSVAATIL